MLACRAWGSWADFGIVYHDVSVMMVLYWTLFCMDWILTNNQKYITVKPVAVIAIF